MPKRPPSHVLEAKSREHLKIVFANRGWTAEDLHEDYGEDLLVRVFANRRATEYSFYVQLKATESIHRYSDKKAKYLSCPIGTSHLEHWSRFWEPVLLILWDAKGQNFYWECVQTAIEASSLPQISKLKTVSIRIPTANTLNEEGIRRIVALTKRRFKRFEREKTGAEVLLENLQDFLNLEVIYDPQAGFLLMPSGRFVPEKGAFNVCVFGKMSGKLKVPQSEMEIKFASDIDADTATRFEVGTKLFERYMESLKHDGKIVLRGKDGIVRTWNTFADYLRDFWRDQELYEADC